MSNFSERYRECKEQIKDISAATPNKIWIALASILLSGLLVAGPITLLINCIMFISLYSLILIGILICGYLGLFLARVFYYKTITNGRVENMKTFYTVDAGVCALIIFACVFILLFI
ncbi:MAG: hypothetical protein K2K15_03565 [Anaeroplasmataceae bacterium]|nr:hypothetical protein [Anaeroplasmataceae bacterium]